MKYFTYIKYLQEDTSTNSAPLTIHLSSKFVNSFSFLILILSFPQKKAKKQLFQANQIISYNDKKIMGKKI